MKKFKVWYENDGASSAVEIEAMGPALAIVEFVARKNARTNSPTSGFGDKAESRGKIRAEPVEPTEPDGADLSKPSEDDPATLDPAGAAAPGPVVQTVKKFPLASPAGQPAANGQPPKGVPYIADATIDALADGGSIILRTASGEMVAFVDFIREIKRLNGAAAEAQALHDAEVARLNGIVTFMAEKVQDASRLALLVDAAREWAQNHFGAGRNGSDALKKMIEKANILIGEIEAQGHPDFQIAESKIGPAGFASILMCVFDAAASVGFDYQQIVAAFGRRLETLKALDAHGDERAVPDCPTVPDCPPSDVESE